MKRIIAILLVTLTVTAVFASCSRRDQFRPPETDAPTGEQTTVAGQPDVSNPDETNPTDTNQSGGVVTDPDTTTPTDIPIVTPPVSGGENGKITGNPYEGWTAEELYASFMEDQERSVYNNTNDTFGNTPYYVILDVRYGGLMFSKLTGQIIQICKDPLCKHTDCIFGNIFDIMTCQVADDRCYLTIRDFKEDVDEHTCSLYSFDLLMNDAKLVYEWRGMDIPKEIYVYQDKVYYDTEKKFDDGQYARVTMVYDMKEKTVSPLREEAVRCSVVWHEGAYEWYTAWEDESLWRYNLDTGEEEKIISETILNPEEGELSFIFMGSSDQTVYFMKQTVDGPTSRMQYNMETGQLQEIEGITTFIYDGNFYQGVNHRVDAYKDDPHYEYYQNPQNLTSVGGTMWGGKWYRYDMQTGEREVILDLRTDDIPDNLTNFLFLDEKYVMVQYQTYKDFPNVYSPNIPEWKDSRRFVVVNMETGQVFELGIDLEERKPPNPYRP